MQYTNQVQRGDQLSVISILVSRQNADINTCNNSADTPLQLAAMKGYTDVVNAMIDELNHRADVEGLQSDAALISFSHACKRGYTDLAITLITDLVCLSPPSADSAGNTLLHSSYAWTGAMCDLVIECIQCSSSCKK